MATDDKVIRLLELTSQAGLCLGGLPPQIRGLPWASVDSGTLNTPSAVAGTKEEDWRNATLWLLTVHRLAWLGRPGSPLKATPRFLAWGVSRFYRLHLDDMAGLIEAGIRLVNEGRFDLAAEAKGLEGFYSALPSDVAESSAWAIDQILAGIDARSGTSSPGPVADEPYSEPEIHPLVILAGPRDDVTVNARRKGRLSPARYKVIKALLDAGPMGLNKDDLVRSSGGDAVNTLKAMARGDADWAAAIALAGQRGMKYRIVYQ